MAPISFSNVTKQVIFDKISKYSSRAIIDRIVGYRRVIGAFKDRSLSLREGRIEDILLLGKGTFMVLLSSQESVAPLIDRSPLSFGDKLIFFSQWYQGFDMSTFEDRCGMPRFPVRLSFPDLAPEFRVPEVLSQFGSIFGPPFQDSIQLSTSVPYLMVAVSPSVEFSDSINFEWEGSIITQRLVVTGRPNQCLRCHTLGHLVKDCPKSRNWGGRPRDTQAKPYQPPQTRPRETSSYATAVSGHSQRQRARGQARATAKPRRQKTAERSQAVERKVYRRRDRATVEEQPTGRPPEVIAQDESRDPVLVAEEQPPERAQEEEILHVDTVVRGSPGDSAEAPSSVFPSVVPASVATGPVEVGEAPMMIPPGFVRAVSPPSHFS